MIQMGVFEKYNQFNMEKVWWFRWILGYPIFKQTLCSTWLPGLENKQVAIENGHL